MINVIKAPKVKDVSFAGKLKQSLYQCMNHIYANKALGLLITAISLPVLKEGYRLFAPESDYPLNSSTFVADNMTCQPYNTNISQDPSLYNILGNS